MEPNRTYKNMEKSNETSQENRNEKGCDLHIRACRKLGHRKHRTDRPASKEKQRSTNKNNNKKPRQNQTRKMAKYNRNH